MTTARLARLALALVVLIMVLTACGGAGEQSAANEADPAEPSGGAGSNEISGEIDFPGHLWTGSAAPVMSRYRESFEADNPGVEIIASDVPFATYHDKTFADMAAGNAPDIVVPYDPQIGLWAEEGLLEPLNPYLEAAGYDLQAMTDDFVPVQQLAIRDGEVYGVLWTANPRVLLYNEALLQAAGASVPTSVEEFRTTIEAVQDESTQTFGFATTTGSDSADATYLDLMPIVAGFGGAFCRDGVPTADEPAVVDALTFIKDLHDRGAIPRGQDLTTYREAFIEGKVATLTIGAFLVGQAEEQNPDIVQDISAAPIPLPVEESISVNVFLSIPSGAENKDAAAAFIVGLLEDQWQSDIAETTVSIPARTDTMPDSLLEDKPWFEAVAQAGDDAISYAPDCAPEVVTEVMETVTSNYQAMLLQGVPPEQVAADIQSQLEALTR